MQGARVVPGNSTNSKQHASRIVHHQRVHRLPVRAAATQVDYQAPSARTGATELDSLSRLSNLVRVGVGQLKQ